MSIYTKFANNISRFGMTFCMALLAAFSTVSPSSAEDTIADLLAREIIGPQLAWNEVQDYCEAHVPQMPEVKSVAEWEKLTAKMRRDVLDRVVFRGEAARWRDADIRVEWLGIAAEEKGYRVKKLRYESLPGLWIPALLYEPTKLAGNMPVMLNVNGHDRGQGKAAKYKQMRCINQAKRGIIALNVEWIGMGQLRGEGFSHARANQLDLCGTSGLAPHYLGMSRALDILLAHPNADPKRVGVAGLSGGGWQTIFISSLDTRVTLANPVAGYSSYRTRVRFTSDLGDSEQTPVDLATVTDYAHLTAMLAPRAALLTYNIKDNCCFASGHALPPLLDAAEPIYKLYGKQDRLRSHVNHDPGTHNFEKDNREALYRLVGDVFFDGSSEFDAKEIDASGEIKSFDQLQVELPEENADFHTLALEISAQLPRDPALPRHKEAATKWQKDRTTMLSEIVRAKNYDLQAHKIGTGKQGETSATLWRLKIGEAWTVPAVEWTPQDAKDTVILVADGGRQSTADETQKLLADGHRVLAVDPFYFGESQIAQRAYLYALLISAVGDRPLGIQASQIGAVARWLCGERNLGPVGLVAIGPRSSLFSLTAAGLERDAIGSVRLRGSYASLKEIIEQNGAVNETPELFCFGLLQKFDIAQLVALAAPRPVTLESPGERMKKELASLPAWYQMLGVEFDPLK